MSADIPRWMAAEVGLPCLEGMGGAVRCANGPAQDLLGKDPAGDDLVAAAAELAKVPCEDRDLLALIARAETAGSSAGTVGQGRWRLLVHRVGPGHLLLLGVPSQEAHHGQLARRATAGDVAAGVSHEVSNALSAIVGWSQLGQQQGHSGTTEIFGLIEESARSARGAARRLLDAVRAPAHQPAVPVDLHALVADVARLCQLQARERNLRVAWNVEPGVHVLGTSSALFTIVWNLVTNAMDALPQGGQVSIGAAAQRDTVQLMVTDDGPGMDEAARARAFDPYFTTKATGTGLGLALVKEAAEALGGHIRLESEPGRGTRFIVQLRRAEPSDAAGTEASEARRRSGVRGRNPLRHLHVLVVEDDDALREMMQTTLSLQHVRVHAVASAAEARRHAGPYHVGLVDLALSDARGDQLLAELRREGIVHASAIVTGASEPPDLPPGAKPDLWLRKPFEPDELLEAIQLLSTFGDAQATPS